MQYPALGDLCAKQEVVEPPHHFSDSQNNDASVNISFTEGDTYES